MKKITIVHWGDFVKYPPVISLIENLLNQNLAVDLISSTENGRVPNEVTSNSNFNYIYLPSNISPGFLPRLKRLFFDKKILRQLVRESMNDSDLLWTTTDIAIKMLGNELLKYKHVMQLMELVERFPLFLNSKHFDFPIDKFAKFAHKVVVPDLDRAYIQQAWWNLKELPVVLPNKPYRIPETISFPKETVEALEKIKLEKRKILLYSGIITPERNIEDFAEAIREKSDYCLYIIGSVKEKEEEFKKFLDENKHVVYLGYHSAPSHLEFIKYAHVGLTPYIPTKSHLHPAINALYCAPNKVYEYSAFGVPMIGTNVLGLLRPFEQFGIGRCAKEMTVPEILKCIDYIDAHYEEMSQNCLDFFAKDDLDQIVKEIIEE
ncbi:glycosyltransferase [Streptococcus ruminantium]|uniref:glycosyltransferase n=1 Tax=Streptococcus ruminantium TaxID=1917441 RepID=UPI0012DEDFED|nr:glycosyltransferase [Streptococcus ruminantium]